MAFEERVTWVSAIVTLLVPVVYFITILNRLGEVPVVEIAYQRTLLVAIGLSIVLTIAGTVVMAVGTAIAAEIREKGAAKEIDRKDERDVTIGRRGELAGYYTASAGAVGVLALTMLEFEHFWIANALYLALVLASLVSSGVKLVAYRRGF